MLPLLTYIGDNKEHSITEALDHIAMVFDVDFDERRQLIPSGKGRAFYNSVSWAKTYLHKSGLLRLTGHGCIQITEEGIKVLEEKPKVLNKAYLQRFSKFRTFSKRKTLKK